MKAKIKNNLNFLNYYIGNKFILTILLCVFLLIFCHAYSVGNEFPQFCSVPNIFDGMNMIMKNGIMMVFILLIPMIMIDLNVIYHCEKLGSNLLRFKNKKAYMTHVIVSSIRANTIFFLIIVFIMLIATFCLIDHHFLILYVANYKTLNILYFMFSLFKLYFIGQWLAFISVLFITAGHKILPLVVNIGSYGMIILHTVKFDYVVSSIIQTPLLLGDYFYNVNYQSFPLEIICFAIYAALLLLIGRIVYISCNKRIKNIGVI